MTKITIDEADWEDAMKVILNTIPTSKLRYRRSEFNTEELRKKMLKALSSWVED